MKRKPLLYYSVTIIVLIVVALIFQKEVLQRKSTFSDERYLPTATDIKLFLKDKNVEVLDTKNISDETYVFYKNSNQLGMYNLFLDKNKKINEGNNYWGYNLNSQISTSVTNGENANVALVFIDDVLRSKTDQMVSTFNNGEVTTKISKNKGYIIVTPFHKENTKLIKIALYDEQNNIVYTQNGS